MGDNKVPQVSTRRAESTIKIINGETMVIGGLIESKDIEKVYEVPLLSQIPLVGRAFKTKSHKNTKTNLIILVTAHVIDENHQSIVTSTAVKEMNEIKDLKDSQAVAEISEPTVDGPDVYGENVEWPREDEQAVDEDGLPVSEPTRTWTKRAEQEKQAQKVSNELEQIKAQKAEEDQPTEAEKAIEKAEKTEKKLALVEYLEKRLKDIRSITNQE